MSLSPGRKAPIVYSENEASDNVNKSELSATVAIQDTNTETKKEDVLLVVDKVFDKYLSTIENEKPTYNTLFNIKKNLIDMVNRNPDEFQSLLTNYLNYRSQEPSN